MDEGFRAASDRVLFGALFCAREDRRRILKFGDRPIAPGDDGTGMEEILAAFILNVRYSFAPVSNGVPARPLSPGFIFVSLERSSIMSVPRWREKTPVYVHDVLN